MRLNGRPAGSLRRLIVAAGICTALTCAGLHARAQLLRPPEGTPPTFEVATIRPSRSDSDLMNFRLSVGRFGAENVTLARLIRFAYNVKSDDQLPKEPGWLYQERFDITATLGEGQAAAMAKMPSGPRFEQYRLMVQSLLSERFALKLSSRKQTLSVLALVVAKNGPRPALKLVDQMTPPMPTLSGGSRGDMSAGNVSMAVFTEFLSGTPDTEGRVVIDETGLPGFYNFGLRWTPFQSVFSPAAASNRASSIDAAPAAPSLLTALDEQLGLKLVPRRAPVEVLIIDHVEQPSPN